MRWTGVSVLGAPRLVQQCGNSTFVDRAYRWCLGVAACIFGQQSKQYITTLGEALLCHLGGTSANYLAHILKLNNVEENSDHPNLILKESPYYDCDSFKTLIHPVDVKTNHFRILSTIIQSSQWRSQGGHGGHAPPKLLVNVFFSNELMLLRSLNV